MRRKGQMRSSMQLRSGSGTSPSQGPLAPNPKGLIQALADLLLEAAGAESVKTKGGDHEHQDHA